ncbi:MAG: ATP-binding protein, partial [Oscillospiraceae bacterium]|nr:ATP-binding protein [Oscillospiraceae bacterium]
MNTAIAKKRISQVLRVDSIDCTDSDFLATHVPFRKIVVATKSGDQFEESYKSEEDIYRDIFNNDLTRNEHQFVIVEGSSGAGKSHFIRWLYAMLSAKEEKDDVVLLIRRSDNTLKGTIRQLLEIKEVKEISNKEAYERLVKANQAITESKFKSTIYHQFIVEIENDTSEVLGNIKRKKLIALLNNSAFQERLMAAGGPIDRIYSKITSSSGVDLDLIAQFSKADLTLDIDFINQLDDADRKAQDFANSLMEGDDDEFIEKITAYMNSFVETVIQTSAGIEPGDFQQIFKEIRQEIKRKGKNLILLVEDITSFTGVNQALLNALVTGHTGSNAVDNLCKLISVVGTTTQYYNQFRDNYRDRITKQITINDGIIGENKSDLVQFVSKYLNAISLDSETLDTWVKNGAYSEDMPVHEDKEHDHWDKFKLASGKQISLFPFTQNAVINLYEAMSDHKTPRYILRDIVEPAVNEVLHDISSFPKFCLGWHSSLPESVENRIGNIVQSTQIAQELKADYRKRLVAFMSFWTNKTLDVTSNSCIAGIKTKIFFELDFGEFVSKLTSTATVRKVADPVPVPDKTSVSQPTNDEVVEVTVEPVQPFKPIVKEQPKIDPKNQKDYDSFRANVISWHRDGGNLIRFVPIRDQISNFVYDAINWQQEGIPLDSRNR